MLTTDRARKRCGKEARDDDCDWVERDQVASQGAPCNAVATRRLNSPIDRSEWNLKKRNDRYHDRIRSPRPQFVTGRWSCRGGAARCVRRSRWLRFLLRALRGLLVQSGLSAQNSLLRVGTLSGSLSWRAGPWHGLSPRPSAKRP